MDDEEKLAMGGGRPIPPELPDPQPYTVAFDGPDDPYHPYNWRLRKKICTSTLACLGTLLASLNSAMFASAIPAASHVFGVGREVATLGTTLFVLGLVAGPMLWAPASELYGRRWPLAIALAGAGIFSIGAATAQDIQTLIICRFFAGMCGASPFAVVPGVLSDLYDNTYRGVAISLYALCVFCGPYLAPIAGGFLASSATSSTWRWTLYIPAILTLAMGALSLFCLSETYPQSLLAEKATRLRRQTGIWGIHASHERADAASVQELIRKYFTRPLMLLVTEPIILFVSMYMSTIYGLVYALLEVYPYVFEHVHGMRPGVSSLPFIGPVVGVTLACTNIVSQHGAYARRLAANNGVQVPEWRLDTAVIGAPIFAASFFWFGWTAFTPSVHWAVPSVAGIFIGFGTLSVFLPCFNYLVDAYLPLAASAVAANVILRSSVAAGFPLFAKQMFQNLGIQWASVITGGATGIGFAAAKRVLEEGAFVFIYGRRQDALDAAVAILGPQARAVKGSVSDLADLDRLYEVIKAERGTLDIVFANAGVGSLLPLGELTVDHCDQILDINVKCTIFTVQKALPLMGAGGSIILNGSSTGTTGGQAFGLYSASKAAIRNLARSWAQDLKGTDIRVNVLSAGPTPTDLAKGAVGDEGLKAMAAVNPLLRVAKPSEIGAVATFLASPDSSFMTGSEVAVDGGLAQI